MAAFVGDGQPVGVGHLLAGLDAVADRFAALEPDAAALVKGEFGVDQVAMVLQQPPNPHGICIEDFLVGLQCQDDVALRPVALLLVADEIRHEARRHVFVVPGAAAVEVAVLLSEPEGVDRPVFTSRFDDVEMGKQQDRLAGASAAQPRHQIAFARRRLEHLHIGAVEPGRNQSGRHGIGSASGIARLCDGIDLDQFLVDVEGPLLLGRQGMRGRRVYDPGKNSGRSHHHCAIERSALARAGPKADAGQNIHSYLALSWADAAQGLRANARV